MSAARPASPAQLLVGAAAFAAQRHRHQRRKDRDVPYVNHPLSVADRLVRTGGVDDPITLAAAMLHDTLEDTATTRDELAAAFGDEVAGVVVEVSDDLSKPKAARKREQIRHAPELSRRARLVKLADKLDNLDDLCRRAPEGWDEQRVRGYFAWAFAVVAGLRGTNPALETALDEVFARTVGFDDATPFRAVAERANDREAALADYLASMDRASD